MTPDEPTEVMHLELQVVAVRSNLRAALVQASLALRAADPVSADVLMELSATVLEAPAHRGPRLEHGVLSFRPWGGARGARWSIRAPACPDLIDVTPEGPEAQNRPEEEMAEVLDRASREGGWRLVGPAPVGDAWIVARDAP